jgi:hypothetical protein
MAAAIETAAGVERIAYHIKRRNQTLCATARTEIDWKSLGINSETSYQ